MRRVGGLFERITSFENLLAAARAAYRGKRFLPAPAEFQHGLEPNLLELQEELRSGGYWPGAYHAFWIHDPKRRLISAAPYRDRVVHHAVCRVVEPIFDRTFIFDSYANRLGKGTHRALARCTAFCRRWRFVLKCDIEKFFPSVDHEVLLRLVARKIKCAQTLELLRRIVASSNPQEPVVRYFPGDDLFSPFERRRGLPIGNLTSQFLANVMLNPLDHFVKDHACSPAFRRSWFVVPPSGGLRPVLDEDEETRPPEGGATNGAGRPPEGGTTNGAGRPPEGGTTNGYIRFADDFLVFGDDKRALAGMREEIGAFLAPYRLSLHPRKCVIMPVRVGVPFLGWRVFPDHRLLRRSTGVRFQRRLRELAAAFKEGKIGLPDVKASLASWVGHLKHGDTWGLRRRLMGQVTFQGPSGW